MSADEGVMSIGLLYKEKSEREKQIYINTCMWNLEKLYRWTYLQSKNRNTSTENKYIDTKRGKEEVG